MFCFELLKDIVGKNWIFLNSSVFLISNDIVKAKLLVLKNIEINIDFFDLIFWMLLKIANILKTEFFILVSDADKLFYKLIKNFLRFDSYKL